jgi:hypothetical protein
VTEGSPGVGEDVAWRSPSLDTVIPVQVAETHKEDERGGVQDERGGVQDDLGEEERWFIERSGDSDTGDRRRRTA